MLTDFQNFVTDRLTGKFATNSYLNIPPHLKYVATLTTLLSENWRQSEICIVINDKSQHSTAKHLSCNGLLDYDFWFLPSVHWRCWLGSRKGIWPVKTEWWGAGVVICLEQGADLHMAQLKPLPLTCVGCLQVLSPRYMPWSWAMQVFSFRWEQLCGAVFQRVCIANCILCVFAIIELIVTFIDAIIDCVPFGCFVFFITWEWEALIFKIDTTLTSVHVPREPFFRLQLKRPRAY